jgi:hypothetical protein
MQKVYLLLRNNQQTGPYSLEELLQFDLKPFDLIWIEGKSAGWYYPQEIDTLQPYLPFYRKTTTEPATHSTVSQTSRAADKAVPKKIYVSLPANVAREPLPASTYKEPVVNHRQETSSFADTFYKPSEQDELKTAYNKSLEEVETDYMNWIYEKKAKKTRSVSPQGVFAACLLIGIASATWWMLNRTPDPPVETLPKQTASFASQHDSQQNKAAVTPAKQDDIVASSPKQEVKKNPVATKKTATGKVIPKTRPQEIIASNTTIANNDYQLESIPEVKQENIPTVINNTSGGGGTATTEKKKIKDKFLGIFKKKPKEDNEQAKPAEEEGGERRSVRREANMAQSVTVRFTVPNDWMMGIKGATATLTNRSNEALVKAVVEVIYYNDDNVVLDKKTVSFNSVKSKQTQTVSIPDHQTATRLEYLVLSATGSVEPFAIK